MIKNSGFQYYCGFIGVITLITNLVDKNETKYQCIPVNLIGLKICGYLFDFKIAHILICLQSKWILGQLSLTFLCKEWNLHGL